MKEKLSVEEQMLLSSEIRKAADSAAKIINSELGEYQKHLKWARIDIEAEFSDGSRCKAYANMGDMEAREALITKLKASASGEKE